MDGDAPPYQAYATIMGGFAALLAGSGALGRALDREEATG
jgi:hypothetical protein